MYELFCLLHERDTELFREADEMLDNTITRMNRLKRNRGMEFVGKWTLNMDGFTEEEANKKGEAYIEIQHNLEGTCQYGDISARLKGEVAEDNTFRFSWQSSQEDSPGSGIGRLRFSEFHRAEDLIEGVFDTEEGDVPEELAYCTFKAHRKLDTLIEEFFGL